MGIETVATYDPIAREFIIHTPNNEASKYWIGGTGQHGKVRALSLSGMARSAMRAARLSLGIVRVVADQPQSALRKLATLHHSLPLPPSRSLSLPPFPAHTADRGMCPTHGSLSLPHFPHTQLTAVFAQLTVAGKWEGPHVFMVRIRDDAMHPVPGVRIKDLGPKMGLNGVDNGQVRGRGGGGGRGRRDPEGQCPYRGVERKIMQETVGTLDLCSFIASS